MVNIVIPPNERTEQFTLHVVKDGIYTDILDQNDSDEAINAWIRKVSVISEKEYGEHLNISSAAEIRNYVKEYIASMKLYDSLSRKFICAVILFKHKQLRLRVRTLII